MKRSILPLLVLLWLSSSAPACMWDYDTLRDEKRGMPGIAEVLAGQWERHSDFFYRDRVAKMKTLLTREPNDKDAMDNLAVAEAKLGELDDAIAVMLDKEKRFPDQYSTSSNLGTFYMFKGDLDAGIVFLKKALSINPDAHFGREKYQLQLAEFLQQAKSDPKRLDRSFTGVGVLMVDPQTGEDLYEDNFRVSMGNSLARYGLDDKAITAVVGMLRFGDGKSPELYYALGDLLACRGDKNLACRAYQRALDFHYLRPDAVKDAITRVSEMQVPKGGLDPGVIAAERVAADKWVAEYQQFEDDLVRAGKNTDDEASFVSFYATHPRTLQTKDVFFADGLTRNGNMVPLYCGVSVAVVAAVSFEIWRTRRRKRVKALLPQIKTD